ncbi:mitochondrial inner membrane protease subunit 1 [Galendromus occidentalis]|uniref:Mitochondrial inner membrane protease subunit n=1 Tax=Galendromus occidentalis TaxID=34638 RepID=A0AAJ6QYG8_9ACAR|nr:mitochondrial inner membrane protease subunit 1 [Galendromus occidentalis]
MVRAVLSLMERLGRAVTRTVVFGLQGVAIGYCIFEYGIQTSHCTGPSMEPTIHDGDIIVIEKISAIRNSFKRDDIVVCRSPSEPDSYLCKRLIGLPGDILTSPDIGSQEVPRGRVWLQGDNYNNSHDSKDFGPVPMGLLKGRAIFKLNTWEILR